VAAMVMDTGALTSLEKFVPSSVRLRSQLNLQNSFLRSC
jgi:hypothetical protein